MADDKLTLVLRQYQQLARGINAQFATISERLARVERYLICDYARQCTIKQVGELRAMDRLANQDPPLGPPLSEEQTRHLGIALESHRVAAEELDALGQALTKMHAEAAQVANEAHIKRMKVEGRRTRFRLGLSAGVVYRGSNGPIILMENDDDVMPPDDADRILSAVAMLPAERDSEVAMILADDSVLCVQPNGERGEADAVLYAKPGAEMPS